LEKLKVIVRKTTAYFYLFCCFVGFLAATAAAAEPWLENYAVAYRTAQQEGKPLLLVLEKPVDLQHQLRQVSDFSRPVDSSLLGPYTLCRIDVTTEEGQWLAKMFGATRFPYVVITDKRAARILYRKAGKVSDQDWAVMLISYREGKRPVVHLPASRSSRICYT
jgi:hypothetical protein